MPEKPSNDGLIWFGKNLLLFAGVVTVVSMLSSKPAPVKPVPPPYAPRSGDFDTTDEVILQRNAMVQLSRELSALGQEASAKVYLEQAGSPPPGTASRALDHIADQLELYGALGNVVKLRTLAKKLYTQPQMT